MRTLETIIDANRPPAIRLYCEIIPPRRLLDPALHAALEGFRDTVAETSGGWSGSLDLVLKVDLPAFEGDGLDPALIEVLKARACLPVDRVWLWGQLADRQSVYLNTHTHGAVFEGWHRLLDGLDGFGLAPEGLFFDIEPDLAVLRRAADFDPSLLLGLLDLGGAGAHRARERAVEAALSGLRRRVDAPVLAAAVPTGWLGPLAGLAERALGAPMVDGAGRSLWPEVTAMAYTSFMLPLLGGPTPFALWLAASVGGLLARSHTRQMARRGASGAVICGTCGIGALGDEPCYPTPASMAGLLAAVAAARPSALSIFNLWGVLSARRSPSEGFEVDEVRWRGWAAAVGRALSRT